MGRLTTAIIWGQLIFLGFGLAGAAAHEGHGAAAPDGAMETVFHNYAAAVAELEGLVSHDPAAVTVALAGGRPTLLAFLDRRCVPCLRMVAIVAELKREFDPDVRVIALDIDEKGPEFRDLFRRFSVWAGPVFFLMDRDGKRLERRIGPQPVNILRARLRALVNGNRGGRHELIDRRRESSGPGRRLGP